MALDGLQGTFANSPFYAYQFQEKDSAASFMPWSHNVHNDPCSFISYTQSSAKSWNPTEHAQCDGETDLQGLVLNILDEADSHDRCSEGNLPTCNPIWSPLREEMPWYFQPDAETRQKPAFPPSQALCHSQGHAIDKNVNEICQQNNDHTISQQWLFNLFKADGDGHTPRPQKFPPGLPIPNTGNSYPSQVPQNKYNSTSTQENGGNSQQLNHFCDISEVFLPQSKMTSPFFQPLYDDQHIQSSGKPFSNEPFAPQGINQLVNSFQSLTAGEHDHLCHGDFPVRHGKTMGLHQEEKNIEQWKINRPTKSTQSNPTLQPPKGMAGNCGKVLMEKNRAVRSKTQKSDVFQDLLGFSLPNTEYFPQTQLNSRSCSFPNQQQNKMTVPTKSTSLLVNGRTSQYYKHHPQQGQSRTKPQLQREKRRMHMSGFQAEGFSTKHAHNCNMRGGGRKQSFPLKSENMQSPRFAEENGAVNSFNTQQLGPPMFHMNDPTGNSGMNFSNFISKSKTPHGGGLTGMEMGNMMPVNEFPGLDPFFSYTMTHTGNTNHHGVTSAMPPTMVMNEGPVIQLRFYLDECHNQWKFLEKETEVTEAILNKTLPAEEARSVANLTPPKTPPNQSTVDQLVVNLLKAQEKVASLLDKMECLSVSLHINIHTALKRHHMAICVTQARRKEEIANMSRCLKQAAHSTEYRDTLLLAIALKDLAASTRKLRTALWCALQMALPKPVQRPDEQVDEEGRDTARCHSPINKYFFTL